ncbi:hypothetical protein [Ruminococcus sp.]|uniref:hypothetical protein n=1 Tax=Ruminococcus sp. TaxID=41978 RepID=UPI0025D54988|nr:hypothetical protein [Ruminococcus sp.]
MKLYDFITQEKTDFDTYDTVFDVCVTVCEPYEYDEGEEKEYYDIFNELIMKNVEVEEKTGECTCVCKWSDFINKNIETFRKAADELWERIPKTDDDLIYEWIKEIHAWMAGYVSESIYKEFVTKYGTQFVA